MIFVIAGVAIQVVNQLFAAFGTQVQVNVGQRMVYDLRYRLFAHLESLGLHHHITTSTGDAVYRVDVDSYAIENLAMSGVFPLATSVITLLVMFLVLLDRDVTVALLSLTVVPFLFLCLRYYTNTMVSREERVKELESKLIERLYETFSAIKLVKSFAREPYESSRYAAAGDTTMKARIAITWQQSLFAVVVATITILGTALVLIVGGMHVMSGRMTVGEPDRRHCLSRCGVRPAVGDRAHDRTPAGGARGRQARARDVRADARRRSTRLARSTPPV